VDPGVHLAELRDPVGGQGDGAGAGTIGGAGVALVLEAELVGDEGPHLVLLGRVLDVRDGLAPAVPAADLGDGGAPGAIVGVREPGMVLGQLEGDRAGGLGAWHRTMVSLTTILFNEIEKVPTFRRRLT
jgi:hypothetical protein